MASQGQYLQDLFLNALRKEHVPVSMFLVNGIKLQGHIQSFDQYVVVLRNSHSQLVYKHTIATVVPSRDIQGKWSEPKGENKEPKGSREPKES